MRGFTVPYSLDSEDKIIGGYVSLRQFAWIVLGCFIALLLFILNTGYISRTTVGGSFSINYFSLMLRIMVVVPCAIGCGLMAFLKLNGLTADRYVIKFILFKLRHHVTKI